MPGDMNTYEALMGFCVDLTTGPTLSVGHDREESVLLRRLTAFCDRNGIEQKVSESWPEAYTPPGSERQSIQVQHILKFFDEFNKALQDRWGIKDVC